MERVVRIVSGRYVVEKDGERRECTAKGNLKIKSDGIVTGDLIQTDGDVIVGVLPRKNRLIRPSVANVDVVAVVVANPPQPDFYFIDKIIAASRKVNAQAIIVVNKTDLSVQTLEKINENYSRSVDKIFGISAKTGNGAEELLGFLRGRLTVFTGQSAVGKTSLINLLFGKDMRVGDVSRKTERGKQTTTVAEIFSENGVEIIDTPGFTAFETDADSVTLASGYSEIAAEAENCRFGDCRHINEPDCAVIESVKNGKINVERYSRYVELYKKLKEKETYGKKR